MTGNLWLAALLGTALLAGVFSGLLLVLFGPLAGALILAMAGSLFALLLTLGGAVDRRDMLFYTVTALFFGLPVITKLTGVSTNGVLQVAMLLAALFGIAPLLGYLRANPGLRTFILFFLGYFILVALSSLFGRSTKWAALYQFASSLKPLLLLGFGFAISWRDNANRVFWWLVRHYWIIGIGFVAFEWGAPGLYWKVFPKYYAGVADSSNIFPSRAVGTFDHPSLFAAVSGLFAIFSLAQYFGGNRKDYWLPVIGNFIILISTVQRQELAATILAGLAVFLCSDKNKLTIRLVYAIFTSSLIAVGFWAAYAENLSEEAMHWGFSQTGAITQPRAQIYEAAIQIAASYFPLGSGLGTFGGAGADKFDLSLYDYYGFRRFWWYGKEDYLMDTYWPNSLAESGYFGSLSLLVSYAALSLVTLSKGLALGDARKVSWLGAAGGMLFILLISPTSPAYQDLRIWFFPALLFGVSAREETK